MKEPSEGIDPARILSENEIQERLYGSYRSKRRSSVVTERSSSESEWTGTEILSGEMRRLRAELISLRKEKEKLTSQLKGVWRQGEEVVLVGPVVRSSVWGWMGRMLGVILMLGAVGYLLAAPMIQASPVATGATPFTVQVAVYDLQDYAQRAHAFLREVGYDAFLVETPRQNGSLRYRIYVGRFMTKEEAQLESSRLSADPRFQAFKDAFVRFQ